MRTCCSAGVVWYLEAVIFLQVHTCHNEQNVINLLLSHTKHNREISIGWILINYRVAALMGIFPKLGCSDLILYLRKACLIFFKAVFHCNLCYDCSIFYDGVNKTRHQIKEQLKLCERSLEKIQQQHIDPIGQNINNSMTFTVCI